MRLPIILDTDPGIDDAAAIAAALFAPELDLQLMTTVAGNVSVEKPPVMRCNCCTSGMRMFHWRREHRYRWCGRCVMPLPCTASPVWKGMNLSNTTAAMAKPAFRAIRDALMYAPQPVTLVAIGPLTNIALLLTHYPECVFNIHRLVIMGGSAGRGNFTQRRV